MHVPGVPDSTPRRRLWRSARSPRRRYGTLDGCDERTREPPERSICTGSGWRSLHTRRAVRCAVTATRRRRYVAAFCVVASRAARQIWRVELGGPTWCCFPSRAPWTGTSGMVGRRERECCEMPRGFQHPGSPRAVATVFHRISQAPSGKRGPSASVMSFSQVIRTSSTSIGPVRITIIPFTGRGSRPMSENPFVR